MMTLEYTMPKLLEFTGCTLRGRGRSDCVWCKGRRTISYSDEVFFCHRCGAKGNRVTLARDIGLSTRKLSSTESQDLLLKIKRAEEAARVFMERVRAARQLRANLHVSLLNLRDAALNCLRTSPENEQAWSRLAFVYNELPRVRAELLLLGEADISARYSWLKASEFDRKGMLEAIVLAGGVLDQGGRWVEFEDVPASPIGEMPTDQTKM
jgi:hypothetical protein